MILRVGVDRKRRLRRFSTLSKHIRVHRYDAVLILAHNFSPAPSREVDVRMVSLVPPVMKASLEARERRHRTAARNAELMLREIVESVKRLGNKTWAFEWPSIL